MIRACILLVFLGLCGLALAQSTAFTYQGVLKTAGLPANSTFDMTFTLYPAAEGADSVSPPLAIPGVAVVNGQFTVELDFGLGPFILADRWLEIAVKPAGEATVTILAPRQRLTPTPSALSATLLRLPFGMSAQGDNTSLFSIINSGTQGIGITGEGTRFGVNGYSAAGIALRGYTPSGTAGYFEVAAPASTSTAVIVKNAGTGMGLSATRGVGSGLAPSSVPAILGDGESGTGVAGLSKTGTALYGKSQEGSAGLFEITNVNNSFSAVSVSTKGTGTALTATATSNAAINGHSTSHVGVLGSVGDDTTYYQNSGVAGYSKTGQGVSAYTVSGAGVYSSSTIGSAGRFLVESGTATAVEVSHNGTGAAIEGRVGAGSGLTRPNTPAILGDHATNIGVAGLSTNGYGVYGRSSTNAGVYGTSDSNYAGRFVITNANNASPALQAITSGSGNGVYGRSTSGIGIEAYGSTTKAAIVGSTTAGSLAYMVNSGVAGYSQTGYGLSGMSDSGTGAYLSAYSGVGAKIASTNGLGLWVRSQSGNIIEGYGSSSSDVEFRVTNTGNVHADGTFSSPAADFAELLPAVAGLAPGDVLVIGKDGKLTRCTKGYQPTVAGVYSTRPAFQGGTTDDLAGKVPVAVVGVVPVKASAQNGAITPGDMLVASNTPGHAMRAKGRQPSGIVIGKALTGLAKGTGVIQMLVVSH